MTDIKEDKKSKWELVDDAFGASTERLKVPGGWLYHVGFAQARSSAMTFVPEIESCGEIEKLIQQKDNVYSERNKVVAAFANFIRDIAYPHNVYVTQHDGEDWEDDWRTILVMEVKGRQFTWHFHDSEKHLLARLPVKSSYKWDGHTTEEKYRNLINIFIGEQK